MLTDLFNLTFTEQLIACFLTSFLFLFCSMPIFLKLMHAWQKKGQPIRLDGPQTHLSKKGTPTMGGILILITILLTTCLWIPLKNPFLHSLLFITLSMGLLGFLDDFLKLKRQSSFGITGPMRLFFEFMIGGLCIFYALQFLPCEIAYQIKLPYFESLYLPLGVFYLAFASIVFTGTTNSVNLTDGLDGLVSVPLIISFLCFGIFAFIESNANLSLIFDLPHIKDIEVVVLFSISCIGSLSAFLYYNKKPARIFMGDVGSLGLGAALGFSAIIIKQEIMLAIIGSLFVIEALSDIIQVSSYKYRHKRVFLMAPIHHHFEKKGWSEVKVVRSFWIFSLCSALVGMISLL